ncbi:MAG TPA: polymer-forming cytoskeletal protein [Verrucomicrobiae bacterium]|nr:polymer-forming cytoskeletal protein [Verrucomicrobiae bacterium]
MPRKVDTVSVDCPKCGHTQPEPRTAYSCICRKCRAHFRVAEALNPAPKPQAPAFELKRVVCFDCGTELDVPVTAESTMCKRCSSYVSLSDFHITQSVAKNFRTHGRLVVEEKGYLLNTDTLVGDAVIKGRLIGKLVARRTLEIHSTAHIKGSFTAGCLIIPAGQHFRWPEVLRIGGAEISGELAADVQSAGLVQLKSTARLFGDIQSGHLVVESGAVFVGAAKIGNATLKPPALGLEGIVGENLARMGLQVRGNLG